MTLTIGNNNKTLLQNLTSSRQQDIKYLKNKMLEIHMNINILYNCSHEMHKIETVIFNITIVFNMKYINFKQ